MLCPSYEDKQLMHAFCMESPHSMCCTTLPSPATHISTTSHRLFPSWGGRKEVFFPRESLTLHRCLLIKMSLSNLEFGEFRREKEEKETSQKPAKICICTSCDLFVVSVLCISECLLVFGLKGPHHQELWITPALDPSVLTSRTRHLAH